MFQAAGYRAMAPGWPGVPDTVQGARANPDSIANHGIDDVTSHYAAIIADLPAKPILIGHSFGGLIAEKLLGQDLAAAAIAIDAAQIKGVLPLSSLRSTPAGVPQPRQQVPGGLPDRRAVPLQLRQRHRPRRIRHPVRAMDHPGPRAPLFEAAAANFSLHSPAKVNTTIDNRGPLLLIMGGQDHTVPEAITKSTLKQYRHSHAVNDLIEFPDRGHSLTIDHGWRDVASACLDWLYKNSL